MHSAPPCKNTLTLNKHTPRTPHPPNPPHCAPPPSPPLPFPPKILLSVSASLHTSINRCDDALRSRTPGLSARKSSFNTFQLVQVKTGQREKSCRTPFWSLLVALFFVFLFFSPHHWRLLTALAIILATRDTETKDLTSCQFPSYFFPCFLSLLFCLFLQFFICHCYTLPLSYFAHAGHCHSFETSKKCFFFCPS